MPDHKIALSIPEVAETISMSESFVSREINDGRLRVLHLGRRTVVLKAEVERYLRRLAKEQREAR